MAALTPSDKIAVVGAGTMGAGIVQVAVRAGHTVLLHDSSEQAIHKGIESISSNLAKLVGKEKLEQTEYEQLLNRITPVTDLSDLAPARLVIEAIIEDMEIKQSLFVQLEKICGENTLLASNTSSLSLMAIATALQRPQNFSGLHFFNPAPIMKLVEVVSGLATDPKVAETLFDTATVWGKQAVHVKSTPGFIVNRVARPFYAEALRVLEEGAADPATIDEIMRESGGFRMGPFELMDLIGHDVNYAVTCSVFSAFYNDPRFLPSLIQKELVDAGYLGRKTGRGFYDYRNEAKKPRHQTTKEINSTAFNITVCGHLGIAEPITTLLEDNGIEYTTNKDKPPRLIINKTHIALSDGRTATERSSIEETDNFILFDLALDYVRSRRIAITASDQASEESVKTATHFFQSLGKSVSLIDDIPGMLVMRTVCMLANEGADAVNQQVCNAQAVDTAMQYGMNYPLGPLAWSERIGLKNIVRVLGNLARIYGEDRYRISPLLQRKVFAGNTFHD